MDNRHMMEGLTNTEYEIYNFLSDGKYHNKVSVHKAINEFAKWESISNYIRLLRLKLEPKGLTVETIKVWEDNRPIYKYRLIRQIAGFRE